MAREIQSSPDVPAITINSKSVISQNISCAL
jgi:hypothetical protein